MGPEQVGDAYPVEIEGRTFVICTQRQDSASDGKHSHPWQAWSFFAYDRALRFFPADAVPADVQAQESIVGGYGETEDEARRAVESRLRTAMQNRSLEGTGFYSPPGGFIYPQGMPGGE
jgi:hypothetical protein